MARSEAEVVQAVLERAAKECLERAIDKAPSGTRLILILCDEDGHFATSSTTHDREFLVHLLQAAVDILSTPTDLVS